jgi:hypothetical protein
MYEENISKLEEAVLTRLGLTQLAIGQKGQIPSAEIFEVASFWTVEIKSRWSPSHLMVCIRNEEGVTYCAWGIFPITTPDNTMTVFEKLLFPQNTTLCFRRCLRHDNHKN